MTHKDIQAYLQSLMVIYMEFMAYKIKYMIILTPPKEYEKCCMRDLLKVAFQHIHSNGIAIRFA